MRREQPDLWRDVPSLGKQAVYLRVQEQLPDIVRQISDEIGLYIDQLLDPRLMVIDHFERHPALVNRIFKDAGKRELRLMVNFGFLFGIPVAIIDHLAHRLVAAADPRDHRRVDHQPPGDVHDLRAGAAAPDRTVQALRPVPAPAGRGG